MTPRETASIRTPIGLVAVTGTDLAIERIEILDTGNPVAATIPIVQTALDQLAAYFAGTLTVFDLPLAPSKTPRGTILRDGIIGIGHGATRSYGALAQALGSGPRAIGQACARNPLPIVVPCHRVLATGGLGHYSAGAGIPTKQWLLTHETRKTT